MKRIVFTIALILVTSTSFAKSTACKSVTEKEIASLFDRWNTTLQTGNPEKVVENYAPRSYLLPTLSNKPRLTAEEKANYFEHFLAKKPVGTINERMIFIGCNTAIDTGLYTFKYADGTSSPARYTYTYGWDGKKWLITSHHSSLMPERK